MVAEFSKNDTYDVNWSQRRLDEWLQGTALGKALAYLKKQLASDQPGDSVTWTLLVSNGHGRLEPFAKKDSVDGQNFDDAKVVKGRAWSEQAIYLAPFQPIPDHVWKKQNWELSVDLPDLSESEEEFPASVLPVEPPKPERTSLRLKIKNSKPAGDDSDAGKNKSGDTSTVTSVLPETTVDKAQVSSAIFDAEGTAINHPDGTITLVPAGADETKSVSSGEDISMDLSNGPSGTGPDNRELSPEPLFLPLPSPVQSPRAGPSEPSYPLLSTRNRTSKKRLLDSAPEREALLPKINPWLDSPERKKKRRKVEN